MTPIGALIGVLVLLFWLIATGRLIPKSSHERELGSVMKTAEDWREIAEKQQELNLIHMEQKTKLIEATTAASAFFRAHTPKPEVPNVL